MMRFQRIALFLSFAAAACGGREPLALADAGPTGDVQLQLAASVDGPGDEPGTALASDPAAPTADAPSAGDDTTLASAFFDPATYTHIDYVLNYPYAYGFTGTALACPPGTKAVSSGAISSYRQSFLTGVNTLIDGSGVYVSGYGQAGQLLQVSGRCVPAAQVQNSTTASKTLRDHRGGWSPRVMRVSCPAGTIAYGGGGFTTVQGSPTWQGSYMFASLPSTDPAEWIYGAYGEVNTKTNLFVSTHCLPRSELGSIVTIRETVTAPDNVYNPEIFVGARCPTGYWALAGGALLHRNGNYLAPEHVGYLTSSNMAADDQGWFARAWTFTQGAQLTAVVRCMTRPFVG